MGSKQFLKTVGMKTSSASAGQTGGRDQFIGLWTRWCWGQSSGSSQSQSQEKGRALTKQARVESVSQFLTLSIVPRWKQCFRRVRKNTWLSNLTLCLYKWGNWSVCKRCTGFLAELKNLWELPGCPLVRTPHSHCWGPRFNLWSMN